MLVQQCTRADTMLAIFERETASSAHESDDVSNTASNTLSLGSSNRVQSGGFSSTPGVPNGIHALEPTHHQRNKAHPAVLPSCQVDIAKESRLTTCRSSRERSVDTNSGGLLIVTLDRRRHTARAHIFGRSKGTRMNACTVRLDSGAPRTFIQSKVWERMLACESASQNGL